LSAAIGRDSHEDLEYEKSFPKPEHTGTDPELEIEKNAEIGVLREKENAERIRKSQINNWWHPKVDIYLDYGVPSLSEDFTRALFREKQWSGGFRISFDLTDGLDARRDASAASYEADSIQFRNNHRAREIKAIDHELRHDLKIQAGLIQDADQDIEKAAQFLRLTESDYNRGVKNGPDMLGAVEKYFEIKKRRTELYRDYHITHAELHSLLAASGNNF
jgi:outer membrane protein TolC